MQDARLDPTWNRKLTIPNVISVFRVLFGVPALVYVLVYHHWWQAAFVVFACFALSDNIDGGLARHYHWRSKFGQMLDPTIDKLYVLFSCGLFSYTVSWWLLVVLSPLIVREASLGLFMGSLKLRGYKIDPPNKRAKWSMFLTNTLVAFSLVVFATGGRLQQALALAFTVLLERTVVMSYQTAYDYWLNRPNKKER